MTTPLKSMSFISFSFFIEKYLSELGFTTPEKVFKLGESF